MSNQPTTPSDGAISRRVLIQRAGLGAVGLAMFGPTVSGAESAAKAKPAAAKPPAAPAPLNRFGRMMQEYLVAKVRAVEQAANARRAALHTKADAEAYVKGVREKVAKCFGPWPEKTPLNARVTGVVTRDGYRIEKVIFESRPNFPVTANLYVPTGRSGKLPGVIGTCGHSRNGKAAAPYQSFAQGLVKLGYVVLLYDPFGQGERFQYTDADLKSTLTPGVWDHLMAGNQQFLVGESLGAWMAWDGIRALDYLLSRPEVDPAHVGVTGNSGGGTQATWLCAAEPRFTMGAPSCFVTTFRRNLENELPADTEQCPPHALALGLDHSDFIAAMAPRPAMVLGQERDYFDARGLEEAHDRLQKLYRLLGAEQNAGLFIGPDYHGFRQANREAMYGWFNRQTKISTVSAEPPLKIEEDATLQCTKRGQVAEDRVATIFSFTRALAQKLHDGRPRLDGEGLRRAITQVLYLPESGTATPPDYRILRASKDRRYPKKFSGTYAVETEPGIQALVYRLSDEPLESRPPKGVKRAILYVSHLSADAELRDEPLIAETMRAEPESAVYACDVRGGGESQPNTTGSYFLAAYGSDFFYAVHGIMLDCPYPGQKTHDVLRVIAWLKANGHEEIHLIGRGRGAIPATFAAVLSGDVTQVTLKNALTSYDDIARSEKYQWPLSSLVPGILKTFDLPDCYRALGTKQLRQIDPWGPMEKS